MFNHSDLLDPYEHPDYTSLGSQTPEVIAVIVILSFLSITGTAGNALVLYVFYQKKDKQVSTLFIIVLAFVDFTTCLIVIPYTIILESRAFMLYYDFLCKLYQFLITSNIPFSALIMVAIAIDRYFCICHPFLHTLNLRRAKIITVVLGMFSCGLGVIVSLMYGVYDHLDNVMMPPPGYYQNGLGNQSSIQSNDTNTTDEFHDASAFIHDYNFGPYDDPSKLIIWIGQCGPNQLIISDKFRQYYQIFYTVLYLISLVIVIVLYVLIYHSVLARRSRRARQKSKALPLVQLQNETAVTSVEETLLTQVNGDEKTKEEPNGAAEHSTSVKGKVVKGSLSRKSTKKDNNRMANLKTAAMLFVVTVVFIITFLPAFLMALELIPYKMIVFYMYFANNVANPVIYSFMNKNFRDDLKKIFCTPRVR